MSPEKMIVLPDRFLAIYENISYKGVCGIRTDIFLTPLVQTFAITPLVIDA